MSAARRIPLTFLLLLLAPALARAADVAMLRLVAVGKDSATLRVELTEPAPVRVSYGEEPGAWQATAEADSATDLHELRLNGLAPTRRYFYQVEVAGTPLPDIGTFVSGRSWVTRRATILATAAAPASTPEDDALAERLFAKESDAIVLLSGEGDADAFRRQHARAMGDRLVLTGPDAPAAGLSIADVALGWSAADLASAKQSGGACWSVALGAAAGDAADVVLQGGAESGLATTGDRLVVTLAGRDAVTLEFAEKALTATLSSSAGTRTATLSRPCPIPVAKKATEDATSADGEAGESSIDGGATDAECPHP